MTLQSLFTSHNSRSAFKQPQDFISHIYFQQSPNLVSVIYDPLQNQRVSSLQPPSPSRAFHPYQWHFMAGLKLSTYPFVVRTSEESFGSVLCCEVIFPVIIISLNCSMECPFISILPLFMLRTPSTLSQPPHPCISGHT